MYNYYALHVRFSKIKTVQYFTTRGEALNKLKEKRKTGIYDELKIEKTDGVKEMFRLLNSSDINEAIDEINSLLEDKEYAQLYR